MNTVNINHIHYRQAQSRAARAPDVLGEERPERDDETAPGLAVDEVEVEKEAEERLNEQMNRPSVDIFSAIFGKMNVGASSSDEDDEEENANQRQCAFGIISLHPFFRTFLTHTCC